jgi:hypothetical protein
MDPVSARLPEGGGFCQLRRARAPSWRPEAGAGRCGRGSGSPHCSVGDPSHFGADPVSDPHLWLTDPDPTPFFSDFKDAKKKIIFCHIFFLVTYLQAHFLQS